MFQSGTATVKHGINPEEKKSLVFQCVFPPQIFIIIVIKNYFLFLQIMKTQFLHSFKRFDSGWSPHQ